MRGDGRATPDAECLSPVPFMAGSMLELNDMPVSPLESPSLALDAHMAELEAEISGLRTKDQERRMLPNLGALRNSGALNRRAEEPSGALLIEREDRGLLVPIANI